MTPGGPFARPDAVRHFGFDAAMIAYNVKNKSKEWYVISLQQYEKLSESKA